MPHRYRSLSAGLALVIGLAGCTPVIEAWRDVSGIAKNDPDPENAPFTRNLAEAEAGPYPNLASVPPPPTRATTAAEREKLTQSLVADRAAAEAAAGTRPPVTARARRTSEAPAIAAAPATAPSAATAAPRLAYAGPAEPSVAVAAAPAPSKTATGKAAAGEPRAGPSQTSRRRPGEAAEASPRNSNLEVPELRSLPEPEAARPAPPPAGVAPAARVPVAVGPPPAALASVMPAAPPPVPDLAPPPPPTTGKQATTRAPGLMTVARLAGAGGGRDQAEIAKVAALYKEQPGRVRVVGYAAAPAAGGDPLASYQAALDRAQTVAKGLAAAGIPASKIQTEATPAAATGGALRVEIQFGP